MHSGVKLIFLLIFLQATLLAGMVFLSVSNPTPIIWAVTIFIAAMFAVSLVSYNRIIRSLDD